MRVPTVMSASTTSGSLSSLVKLPDSSSEAAAVLICCLTFSAGWSLSSSSSPEPRKQQQRENRQRGQYWLAVCIRYFAEAGTRLREMHGFQHCADEIRCGTLLGEAVQIFCKRQGDRLADSGAPKIVKIRNVRSALFRLSHFRTSRFSGPGICSRWRFQ